MVREILITPVLNGFIAKVGCQTVVFLSREALTKEIERYYADPEAVEKEYIEKAINKMQNNIPAEAPRNETECVSPVIKRR